MLVTTTLKATKIENGSVRPIENEFSSDSFQTGLNEYKKFWVERALEATNYNQVKASKILKINRNTLKKLIDEYNISLKKNH